MAIMHCMHVLHPHMHHMHGGIYKRKEDKEMGGINQFMYQSSYVLNQDINNQKPSYLTGDVFYFSKLKSRIQSRN